MCIQLGVNNKEGKRVLNALYALYKIFLESHMPGIQKLTNGTLALYGKLWAWPRVQANNIMSSISTENTSRS